MFLSDKPVLVGQRWTSGWLYSYQQGLRSLYQYMEIREWVCLKAMDANVGDSVHIWK